MPDTILTDLGAQKITQAAGSQSAVTITHVALGDGGGANYAPDHAQTGLKSERTRKQIDSQYQTDATTWSVSVAFPADTPAFDVREIGFFDDQGNLIALWAGLDVQPRQTGVIVYEIKHVLVFDHMQNGVITVSAPDDEVFGLAVATSTALANMQLEQLTQADEIATLKAQMQAMGQ